MNKRQKKKLFKQVTGKNPPKKMKYSGEKLSPGDKQTMGRKKTDSECFLGLRETKRSCNTIYKGLG